MSTSHLLRRLGVGLNRGFLFSQFRPFCYVTLILRFHSFQSFILSFIYLTSAVSLITLKQFFKQSHFYFIISFYLPGSNCYSTPYFWNIYCYCLKKEYYSITGNHISVRICFIYFMLFQHC